jgi:methionyl-tRNA synthetase
MSKPRRILVTAALPYANGSIHMGHLLEHVQTDIWVRWQRHVGNECYFICASDAHGTPIMISARKEGITPEALIERFRIEHLRDFDDFRISFDNFHSTHSEENRELVEGIYAALERGGHIAHRTIRQAYDEAEQMFLPDRFVRGTCPRCKAADQYGDSCEVCGATYSPAEMIEAVSILSDTAPVERDSEHVFFRLSDCADMLREWIAGDRLQSSVVHKLMEWFEAGLQDWDISRDAPYFGFEIPGLPGKYFYVWLDAPVGYMASFLELCRRREDLDFDTWWRPGGETELYHFIGKDIVYFHSLFWPAVLAASGYRTPDGVNVHGFLTVNGEKMSKSRGTFINARTYLDHLDPEYLRYYYAAKLGTGVEDIDLNLDDFVQKVNSDLVGKVVNIASRCASFVTRLSHGELAAELPDAELREAFLAGADEIAAAYEAREFSRAMRLIMALADRANQYIDHHKPWVLAKEGGHEERVQAICTQGLDAFRSLVIMLKPVLPRLAADAEAFLGTGELAWADLATPLAGRRIEKFRPLLTRIDPKAVAAMVEASKASVGAGREAAAEPPAPAADAVEPLAPEIGIEGFREVDLRVARVVAAEAVEGADRLLRLTLDVGDHRRQVLSGIRTAYEPSSLEGRYVIVVANLKPRKMRFGVSEGMILAAGSGDEEIFLLSPDQGARPGMRVT